MPSVICKYSAPSHRRSNDTIVANLAHGRYGEVSGRRTAED
jgi:hypothetical protein